MKFKYLIDLQSKTTDGRAKKRPVIEISLEAGGVKRGFFAVIDSGADVTTMSVQVAEILGVDWRTLPSGNLLGISGIAQRSYHGRVKLTVSALDDTFEIPVVFTEANLPILLGQEGFFDRYRIKFEKDHDTFEITKAPGI
ncbi:MAG: retropepsin-like aspartic protease [bacterium]|nr:retropepsin-like aspartic protease [bacterium]